MGNNGVKQAKRGVVAAGQGAIESTKYDSNPSIFLAPREERTMSNPDFSQLEELGQTCAQPFMVLKVLLLPAQYRGYSFLVTRLIAIVPTHRVLYAVI